ncbi:MAG: diaminopimelate decarboxylase [Mycobacterium sp.]|nr:diaminopimelate decarboxylase [Mycobacterium sp.]
MTLLDIVRSVRTETGHLPSTLESDASDDGVERLDVVLRTFRRAAPWAALSCPAEVLRRESAVPWVRRHRIAVDVGCGGELDRTLAAGVSPARIVMHCEGAAAIPIRRAVSVGTGRFVMSSTEQVAMLAGCAQGRQSVMVDVSHCELDKVAEAIVPHKYLDLIGLHCQVMDSERREDDWADEVRRMIGQMALIRFAHGLLLTRLSLARGPVLDRWGDSSEDVNRRAAAIEDALDDACARFRFPRPALVLSVGSFIMAPSI